MKTKTPKIQPIGITENSDPSYHLEIFDNLYDANIIITKNIISEELIKKLIENKDKIILHLTCTGMGGSLVELNTPPKETTYAYFKKLLMGGFPVEQTVLRIDPCVPTKKGIETALSVIDLFSDTGIKRVRFSSLDIYNHIKPRFKEEHIPLPYDTFNAPKQAILALYEALKSKCDKYGMELESCGEELIESISCISQKDIDILGLTNKIELIGNKGQRKHCNCPANKKQLIKDIGKPHPCPNNCLYCFWKDKEDNKKEDSYDIERIDCSTE